MRRTPNTTGNYHANIIMQIKPFTLRGLRQVERNAKIETMELQKNYKGETKILMGMKSIKL